MIYKLKKILYLINFHLIEYQSKKKYKKYFDNEYLIRNLQKIKKEDINIFSKYIYDKQFRLLKHRYDRYLNMLKIITKIKKSDKNICVVEFGVYRGDSFVFFSKNLNKKNNKILGIDTFQDFPKSNSKWKKGKFINTSKHLVYNLLSKYNLVCKYFLIESPFEKIGLKKKFLIFLRKLTYFILIVINMRAQ